YVSTTDDRPQLVEEAGVVARPISEQRVDVDSSGRHGSNSLAQSLWLPITQIRAYRWCSPPRIGCAIMSPNRARQIGDVVLAIEAHGPSHDRVKRAVHHEAGNKPLGHSQLSVRRVGMAEVKRHAGSPRILPSRIIAPRRQSPAMAGAR